MNTRTRVKICGITSVDDALAAAEAGADAIGLVFYPPSPRNVELVQAAGISRSLPPFVARVAVFVNPTEALVREVLDQVGVDALQFHGEEPPGFCQSFGKPYLKATRMRPEIDLLESLRSYESAAAWLLDTYREDQYGGVGQVFEWDLIPSSLSRPVILSGGLDVSNVARAIARVRPWAVDVSSGVESTKGKKDAGKIARFIEEVSNARF